MKFKVEITETLQKTVEIEAKDASEAITKVRREYFDETYVLDSSNYIDTTFEIIEE